VTLVGLLQAAAVVTLVFSVVTLFDFAHRNIELFAHFRLQYLAASLLLLLVFAVLRHPVYASLMLIVTIVNSVLVLPWYVGGTTVSGGTELKVLHANVLAGNDEYQRLFDLIDAEQPDIIFLQEVSLQWSNALGRLQQEYPYNHTAPREGNFGIAIYSRLPLDTASHIDSPPLGYPTITATANVSGQPLTMISTHPTIPIGRDGFESRNGQLTSVAALVNRSTSAVVLVGDLNVSMWAHSYRSLEKNTGLRNARRGFGIRPTWPTFMPFAMIPIDHVLVSDAIGIVETRTGPRIGSDHLPLIVTITI